jgi:signal peptidase II
LWRWLVLAGVLIILDQLTKLYFDGLLRYGQRIAVLPFFDFTLLYNPGAAFSFLAQADGWQRWFFTILGLGASVFIVWMMHKSRSNKRLMLALTLILGGALGNVIDRIAYGHVVDFLDFHWDWLSPVFFQGHFPAFNVADSAISVGAVCLILDELIRVRKS